MSQTPLEYVSGLRIGTVEYVSPVEIKVLLDVESPEYVALNAGTPRSFPRVNSYVLFPNEKGYLVGQVEWITIERSDFPKRGGMKDFGLVDLPYPLRKMSLIPLGVLYKERKNVGGENVEEEYIFRRGAEAFPTIGDGAYLPTDRQLHSIVESGEKRRVKIGTSPLAADADVHVDPDRLFGRHLAVLGNTGSGKSCTVAGLIRWSLEAAQKEIKNKQNKPNARFILLDPNGEYAQAFSNDKSIKVRLFQVSEDNKNKGRKLQLPLWFWNSSEWCCFTQAGERAHRPILQQALRIQRNKKKLDPDELASNDLLRYLQGMLSALEHEVANNSPFQTAEFGKYIGFIRSLEAIKPSLEYFAEKIDSWNEQITSIIENINNLLVNKCKEGRYYKPLAYGDVNQLIKMIKQQIEDMGGETVPVMPVSEDAPISFSGDKFLLDLEFLAVNSGNRQWFDSFISRVKSLLSDLRIKSIIEDEGEVELAQWLYDYIGENKAKNGSLTIIDLSLVPSDIIHIVTAVIARMVFEALQRYRKINQVSLPTVLVMEEAHTFIKGYRPDAERNDSSIVCCQVFERIAREGRKFGLGLLLSSQRPSELSQTVLSQCNTFILHRISNDRDQELVKRLVPDNLRGLLSELPSLPTQNAIILGWATELPILVKIDDLPKEQRPQSEDPDFWAVWTGKDDTGKRVIRKIDWQVIAEDWQKPSEDKKKAEEKSSEEDENHE